MTLIFSLRLIVTAIMFIAMIFNCINGISQSPANPVGKYLDVNGMKMYYEVSGKGEPLVVLHGAYMNIKQ